MPIINKTNIGLGNGQDTSLKPPTDKWRLVQIVFFLHGISALLPWNMLINADSYFVDYKLHPFGDLSTADFPNDCQFSNQSECLTNSTLGPTVANGTVHVNGTVHPSFIESAALINYRQNFLPYLSTASKLPNICFQLINLLFSSSYAASSNRIVFSFVVEIGLFLLTIFLAFIDSTLWPEVFFWLTISIAVIFNTVNGIFQSCIYCIGAKFPMQYTNYITLGFSFSGTIASVFLIVSLFLSPHPKLVAIYYFTLATVFMLICLIGEHLIRNNAFLKYHVLLSESLLEEHSLESKNTNRVSSYENPLSVSESDLVNSTNNNADNCAVAFEEGSSHKTYLQVFRHSWIQLLNIVLVYFVSFSIFPAVQAGIKPLNSLVPIKFFVPVFCFLFFASWASVGNYVAERFLLPAPKDLIYWVMARFAFIPFFMLCNYVPHLRTWPVFICNDVLYAVGSAFMAFSSGFTSALGMMYAPRCVPPKHASVAAMMASASVIIGILAGVQFSIVLRLLVTSG